MLRFLCDTEDAICSQCFSHGIVKLCTDIVVTLLLVSCLFAANNDRVRYSSGRGGYRNDSFRSRGNFGGGRGGGYNSRNEFEKRGEFSGRPRGGNNAGRSNGETVPRSYQNGGKVTRQPVKVQ